MLTHIEWLNISKTVFNEAIAKAKQDEREKIIKIMLGFVRMYEPCPICRNILLDKTKTVQRYRKQLKGDNNNIRQD